MAETKSIWKSFIVVVVTILSANVVVAQNICDSDICVVEFNTGWNTVNGVGYLDDLEDCGIKRINIDEGTWQADYGIVVVPTVIVFNGKEVSRFQADLSFQLSATKRDVQNIVDDILLSDF